MSNPSDPVAQVRSAREALTVAEELISAACPAAAAEYSMEFWKTAASAPLAAILYTVAAARRADGIIAARQMAADITGANPSTGGREWTDVAARCPNKFLAQCLLSVAPMNPRQRNSISLVMVRALGAPPEPAEATPIAV